MLKDIFTKKENQIMIGVIILSVFLIMAGFYFLNKNGENGLAPRQIPDSKEEIVWKPFESKKYDFTLEYPNHFDAVSDSVEVSPAFNFYFDKGKNYLPFDTYVNQSHVSVYPEGLHNAGPGHMESYTESEFTNSKGVTFVLREYKTFEGEAWSIMAFPQNSPDSWVDFGFVWISTQIKDMESKCFDGNVEIDTDFCNPLEGDQFYISGKTDQEFIEIGREILDRFSF